MSAADQKKNLNEKISGRQGLIWNHVSFNSLFEKVLFRQVIILISKFKKDINPDNRFKIVVS